MTPIHELFRQRRGFTLTEVMFSSPIMLIVVAAVISVMLLSARVSANIRSYTRSQTNLYAALDVIRYTLCMGSVGTVTICNLGQTITFQDPNKGSGITSAFRLINGDLMYDEGLGEGSRRVVAGLAGLQFQFLPGNATVRVTALTDAMATAVEDGSRKYDANRPLESAILVFLRN